MSAVRVAKQELRPFFTPKALAEYLSISERTVREMLSKQRIPSYKVEVSDGSTLPTSRPTLPATATARHDAASDRARRMAVANRRERPISRVNPSGEKVWRARAADPAGRRRYLGAFNLKREAQAAIDAAYDEWAQAPPARDTVGEYAADWTDRHPRSARTNYDRKSKLRQVLDVKIDGRSLREWPFTELQRTQARELVDHMLRYQGRAAAGASAILRVLSAMAEDAIDDQCATINPFKGVRIRAVDPRVTKPAWRTLIWTLDQMHEFAAAAGGDNEPMIRMLSDCGTRVGEMLALRRALQDLKTGVFRIVGTAWNGAVIETSREKNHDREGPIPPETLALLRAIPRRIDVEWLFPTPGSAHTRRPRIGWPAHEEILAELETMSYTALSRRLGVSDNALRNRIRAYEAGREPGGPPRHDGGKLWRYDNWMRDVWNPTIERTGMSAAPKEFRASWETHLIAAGANTDDVAAIAGHSINVQAEHYRQALHRSSDFIRSAIG